MENNQFSIPRAMICCKAPGASICDLLAIRNKSHKSILEENAKARRDPRLPISTCDNFFKAKMIITSRNKNINIKNERAMFARRWRTVAELSTA
jgi:hypothetical protein